ncbi:polysaccharide biosynthesis protein [Candidatus Pelagibacter ubique]|nr:polysaccharide biosynthesis protein [Candidatus Pelagibacter ubique]
MKFFLKKNILITGGTGSIGSRLADFLIKNTSAKKIIIFSRDEQKHFEMEKKFNNPKLRYLIGDVRDRSRLDLALKDIDLVFHTAAQKHVGLSEYNPQECIKTNITGTQNVIESCILNKVKKFLLLSTDKAVNPINLYGASKLVAEKITINANNLSGHKGCKFAVARYGNVIGSKGSVIPFFLELIKEKKTIPLTDKEMTRFWISYNQAVKFVLNSMQKANPGDIFVPKLRSQKIIDLIKLLSKKSKIKIIGARPGEKIHEELLTLEESCKTKKFKEYYLVNNKFKANKETFEYKSNNFLMKKAEEKNLYNSILKTFF